MSGGLTATQRRQIVETRLTPADFLRELVAREAVKLPAKRYRVEHKEAGQGGNSYLLTLEDARITVGQYGGTITALVSTTTFYRATAKFLKNACEQCDQPKGEPCLSDVKDPASVCAPHDVRAGKTTRSDRVAFKLPDCPKCQARPGRPCRTEAGRKQMPHRQRLPPKPKKVRVSVKDLAACAKCGANAGESCRTTNPNYPGSALNARVPKVNTHAGRPRAAAAA